MKAVLISIQPKWCDLIASGKKTVEVRKTRPKLERSFKCYIYQTLPKSGDWNDRDGRVIGEFVCDNVGDYHPGFSFSEERLCFSLRVLACLSANDVWKYSNGKTLYGWHISALKIYDKPKKLSEFRYYNTSVKLENGYPMPTHEIKRPPQSWCYVEELTAV